MFLWLINCRCSAHKHLNHCIMWNIHQQTALLGAADLITWKYFCCQETFAETVSAQLFICWQLVLCVRTDQKLFVWTADQLKPQPLQSGYCLASCCWRSVVGLWPWWSFVLIRRILWQRNPQRLKLFPERLKRRCRNPPIRRSTAPLLNIFTVDQWAQKSFTL